MLTEGLGSNTSSQVKCVQTETTLLATLWTVTPIALIFINLQVLAANGVKISDVWMSIVGVIGAFATVILLMIGARWVYWFHEDFSRYFPEAGYSPLKAAVLVAIPGINLGGALYIFLRVSHCLYSLHQKNIEAVVNRSCVYLLGFYVFCLVGLMVRTEPCFASLTYLMATFCVTQLIQLAGESMVLADQSVVVEKIDLTQANS